eukprot:4719502-Pleurochrysis_carterae.AAC.1
MARDATFGILVSSYSSFLYTLRLLLALLFLAIGCSCMLWFFGLVLVSGFPMAVALGSLGTFSRSQGWSGSRTEPNR